MTHPKPAVTLQELTEIILLFRDARDWKQFHKPKDMALSLMLESGQLGLRENPRCWQVEEFWQTGHTLSRSIESFISSKGFLLSVPPR